MLHRSSLIIPVLSLFITSLTLCQDCDEDGILDINEIKIGHDTDFNEDGYPDSCQDPTEINEGFFFKPSSNRYYFCFTNEGIGPILEKGTEIELEVKFDVRTEGVIAWAFGIQHDNTKLEILEASTEERQIPEIFFETTKNSLGQPPSGFVSAVVLSLIPEIGSVTLSPNKIHTVARAKYRVLETISPTSTTLIKFSNELTLDGPPTQTSITINRGSHRPQFAFSQALGLRSLPLCSNWKTAEFKRGDSNNDSKVNLTDAIWIFKYLLEGQGQPLICEDTHDINDDGIVDISDPINLLAWLFINAPSPPPPFSICGFDLTLDELNCQPTCP